MDLDACETSAQIRNESSEEFCTTMPQAMRNSVQPKRMQPRIGKHYFDSCPRRWVAAQDGIDILQDAGS
jgi:hypothetical protein